MTTELLQKCTGHSNIHHLIEDILYQSQPTIKLSHSGTNPILSRGDTATLQKKKRNTSPIPKPNAFGNICHYNIVYRDGRAIGGINYALLIVCQKTSYISIHYLKDLEPASIRLSMLDFLLTIRRHPTQMIAGRDFN